MIKYRQLLEQFRDLKIPKTDLPPIDPKIESELKKDPILLQRVHIINLLKRYKQERLTESDLFDWVHFVWFSKFFESDRNDFDCIVSVMDILETLEEDGEVIPEDIDECLRALESNTEAELA
jgi:hypothetical protein